MGFSRSFLSVEALEGSNSVTNSLDSSAAADEEGGFLVVDFWGFEGKEKENLSMVVVLSAVSSCVIV